jgi:putative NADH-flavin reductase
MKKVLFLVLVFALTANLFAQTAPNNAVPAGVTDLTEYGVRIAPDKRLIVMRAALGVAGLETSLTENGTAFRQKMQTDLGAVNPDLQQKMQAFLKSYRGRHPKATSAEISAPFISLAYAMGQDLSSPERSTDLPDDLLEVLDFAPFVREFYQTTNFETKLPEYTALYQAEGDKMRGSTDEMVKTLIDYLKTKPQLYSYERIKAEIQDPKDKKKKVVASRPIEHERRFFVVPDLLASTGTVNFRNIGDDYYVIVPPSTNLRFSEARRAYLQYILDPIVLKNAKDISTFRDGIKVLLDERRKENSDVSPDVFLAVLRSLVAAIDVRETEYLRIQSATETARREIDFAKTIEAKKTVSAKLEADKKIFTDETALELSNAYERGAVLAFYFSDQLKGLENSGFDIASSLREMVLSLDTTKEGSRLAQYADARKRALVAREERKKQAAVEITASNAAFERTKLLKSKLDEVEVLIKAETAKQKDAKNYEEIENRLKQILNEFPNESSVYYALGRVSSLSASEAFDEELRDQRLENAKLHYGNAIRQANSLTDPALIQLSYVAVGKIFEFQENNNAALQAYQLALKPGRVKGGGYEEATAAINRLTAPKKP